MENRAHALAAGLFALILGGAVIVALWWFSQNREPTREYVLVSKGSVNGLNVQARVRYRGMAAGTVSAIDIDPDDPRNILVRIRLREDLPITRGTRATLGTQGVTGLAFIQLDDRGADPAPLTADGGGPPRIVLEPGLIELIGDRALQAAERVHAVADRLATMFDDQAVARLRRTLERLESAAAGMDRSFAELPATVGALRSALSPQNLDKLAATLANLEAASREAAPAAGEVRALVARIDHLAQRVDQAAGTAGEGLVDGTLPQVDDLLRELTATSRRLGRVLEEIEAAPQVLLAGREAGEPGPGEEGYVRGGQ
ncbi:MlaD family protein [Thauera sinica]|uniref:MlaD family protein n=1 Tax=Thauera sinica TaxID=2665146 RepID=A0ABW1AWJ0_9RHOO|nr:MlaD family protein [Thauera sp. K11]ATE60233.1 organic solvent ABC transporter substrate-binding protein [Thauera sp. K11]